MNSNSILETTKKMLGLDNSYDVFDPDLIVCINSTLGILCQMGVGPSEGFYITGSDQTWDQFYSDGTIGLRMVQTYVWLKTKLLFDPPTMSSVAQSYQNQIKQLQWRLYIESGGEKQ